MGIPASSGYENESAPIAQAPITLLHPVNTLGLLSHGPLQNKTDLMLRKPTGLCNPHI